MVGSVSTDSYRQLVDRGRELEEVLTGCHFVIGDLALEIEPTRSWGGSMQGSRRQREIPSFVAPFGAKVGLLGGVVRPDRALRGEIA